ncbi:hypothetical protein [Aliterella atlantica]|uniref:Uncharacterized protein n=1 Tax=Aliterella atlantica CENA595 TaxID=1618023 RepID=A0A0D8ZX69_9CYAN|nr:hypothetical protein [Aliterella atlantica]KJH72992.1 hypothetical protein UH38_02645 [Aliterella atlantica CENA595]
MTKATLTQERFQQNDIPTRLSHLSAHLAQIQFLATNAKDEDKIISLMCESRYYIEWTVPQLVDINVDSAALLVDLGRTLTRWLFNWETIWTDSKVRCEIAQIAKQALEHIREMSKDSEINSHF